MKKTARALLLAWLALFGPTALAAPSSAPGKPQQLTSPDQVPEGLAKSDWQSIRAAYEAGRHEFQPTARGWQAGNPGQQWLTTFDQRGFLAQPRDGGWQWGLELQSYGFGEARHTIAGTPTVQAEGQRLSYQWDATVQEWFVNDRRGLEHGFTLKERPGRPATQSRHGDEVAIPSGAASLGLPTPAAAEPTGEGHLLAFTLATRGGLCPHVTGDALGVEFRDPAGATVVTYAGLKVWDADGRVLSARFELADVRLPTHSAHPSLRLLVDERGARYPLTIDPTAQQAYLKASNTWAGAQFGFSVAVSGDTVVVGAFGEDSNATGVNGNQTNSRAGDAGAAYVFVRSGATWTQQAYLKASNTGATDQFGTSVAVSGDTVVVGTHQEDSNATGVNGNQTNNRARDAGAAYVFVRSGTTWTQQAYLKASNNGVGVDFGSGAGDYFGWSVAMSGDTVVVGAFWEDSNATGVNGNQAYNGFHDAGAAYIFTGVGPVTPPVAGLTLRLAPGAGGERRFIATGSPGGAHRLQAAAAITGPWTEVPGAGAAGTAAANGELLLEDATPPSDTVFYRAIGP